MHKVSRRRALVALAATGAMVATGLGVSAASTIPSGSKKVSVSAGKTHKNINGTLPASGALMGQVTIQGSHKPAVSAGVEAFNPQGNEVASGFTDSHGKWHIYGLDSGKYRVCVLFAEAPSSTAKFGLSPACIGSNAAPSFFNIPKDAKQFAVHRGHADKANLALPKAGAISGTVRSSSGKPLRNVDIEAFSGQQFIRGANTNKRGQYTITNLRPGKYKTCFIGENSGSVTVNTPTGVLRQCWKNVPDNGTKVPSNAKSVPVRAGKNTGGINAKMRSAGAISGKVFAANNHKPLTGSSVEAFQGRSFFTSTFTDAHGAYVLKNLPAGKYKVCAIGGTESSTVSASTGRCYKNSPLQHFRPGSTAKSVAVKLGKIHKGVNVALATSKFKTGTMSGKVTGPGGVGIGGANVEAEGASSGTVNTAPDGTWTIANLAPGKYTVCTDPGEFATPSSGSAPATGYSKVCYKNAKWSGGSTDPAAGSSKVTVKAGKTVHNVNTKVGVGGAISGTAKLAGGGSSFVDIEVLDSKGNQAAGTEASGSYTVPGLTPSSTGYFVCFSAIEANFDPPNKLGYIGQCYQNKTWTTPGFGELAKQIRPTKAERPAWTGHWVHH